jgi:hypothetical protein
LSSALLEYAKSKISAKPTGQGREEVPVRIKELKKEEFIQLPVAALMAGRFPLLRVVQNPISDSMFAGEGNCPNGNIPHSPFNLCTYIRVYRV